MLEFAFPDVGEGIHEGTIVKWRVKEGDEVKSDQVLVEIETDKAIVEIPSPRAGVIAKTFHKEKEVIKVGEILVAITDKGEAYVPSAAPAATSVTAATTATASIPTPDKGPGVVGSIDASNAEIPAAKVSGRPEVTTQTQLPVSKILPATRMLAQKLGVDTSKITGTGANGMITDADVLGAKNGGISPAPVSSVPKASKTFSGPVTKTPYKGIRKVIGDHMMESLTKAAQVTHYDTANFTNLVAKRELEKPLAEAKNIKLTFLAYITKAVADTLKEFPIINAELDEAAQEVVTKQYFNIGIAVDTDDGLFVPTIKDADKKDLYTVAQEIVDLAEKARTKKLTPQDMSGGTFTITNYGSIGGDFATAVINYPEVAILGLGKMRDSVIVDTTTKQPTVAKTMGLALTFDHRIIDGATAARFMNALIKNLETV